MRKIMLIIAAMLFLFTSVPSVSEAKALTLKEITEGVCRIGCVGAKGSVYGSGVVVKKTDKVYRILTNGHVANGYTTCTVEFFKDGKVSQKLPGRIVYVRYIFGTSMDMAVVEVNVADMMGIQPRVIPIAPPEFKYQVGQYIKGAGCPAARWCQAWEARVFKNNENTISFNMPPEGGQSGSGILVDVPVENDVVTCVAGIVTWRIGVPTQHGAGLSNSRIYNILGNLAKPDTIESSWKIAAKEVPIQKDAKKDICTKCGAPKELHTPSVIGDKQVLLCPKCKHHNLYWNQHDGINANEQQYCGPNGCFPWGRRPTPPIQQPQPNPQQPPNDDGQLDTPPDIKGPWVGPGDEDPAKPDDNLQKRIMQLENEKSVLSNENNRLRQENAEIGIDNKKLADELGVVYDQKAKVEETVVSLEKNVASLNGEKVALTSENTGLKEKVSDLSSKLDKLNSVAQTAQSKVDELVKLKDGAIEKFKLLEGENGGLKQKIAEHLGVIDVLKKHVDATANKIEELATKKAELLAKLEADKGPLGEYFRSRNTETVSVLGVGGLIGMVLWNYLLQPFLIKRTGKVPTRLIGAIGYKLLKKKVKEHLEDDNTPPPDILAEDLVDSVKKK